MLKKLFKKEHEVKAVTFISEMPSTLEMKVDFEKLEVCVATEEGILVGFAQMMPAAWDGKERVSTLSIFETSMQNKGVGRMMLSGLIAIAKYHAASKIIVYPVPVDLQIEEIQPLTNEVLYSIYEKLGFKYDPGNADMNVTIKKMYLEL